MSNIEEKILSPITQKPDTTLYDVIDSETIINLYKKDFNLDVKDYFKDIKNVSIIQCNKTKYRFFYPYSVTGEGKFYEQFNSIAGDNKDWYRKWGYDYQFAFDQIGSNEKILDIGCGTGEFLKRISVKTKQIFGLELNTTAYEQYIESGLNVTKETIQEYAVKNIEVFDVVCIFQVLEHVYDVKSFLEAALKTLKKGGKLIIGVPNNEPFLQRYDKYITLNLPPHHVGLWNQKSLENIQPYFNLKILKIDYDEKIKRWVVDSYLRTKFWLNIKSKMHSHSFLEKIKMLALTPFSLPISVFKYLTKGINGDYIVVLYEKI